MKPLTDESCLQLAARYLRRQVKQLAGQIEGVRKAEDVECVHRARVASRRLRAGLRFFADCYPGGRAQVWRKGIRKVGRDLGRARDLDVQIAYVRESLSRVADGRLVPGIARVLVQIERKRDEIQPKVLAATARLLESRVLHEILQATKKVPGEGKKGASIEPSDALYEHAAAQIGGRSNDLLAFRACLADANDYRQHHAMRIAAKRLRYTVEICKPIYGERATASIDALKQVQSFLGEIHDCDVWVERLRARVQKESKRLKGFYGHTHPLDRLQPGIEYLELDRLQYRQELFAELIEFWTKLEAEGVWDDLNRLVSHRGSAGEAPSTRADGKNGDGPPVPLAPAGTDRDATRPEAVSADAANSPVEEPRNAD